MSPGWIETYLGLIFQIYGLAFFVLGIAALLSMRPSSGSGLTSHLGWLAAFGMLHGLREFIEGERLHNPAAWLAVLGVALMVASFAALMEFGRRLWNGRPGGRRLAAVPLYAAAGLGTVALLMTASEAAAGLELGARYLVGAPGAAMAGIGLLAHARAMARQADIGITQWLTLAAHAMLGYAALTLFLSPGSGRLLADWLPTTADFLATTGLPVQLARALCAVLLAVSFVMINRRIGSCIATNLQRVTGRLDGFFYQCCNDPNWTVMFMSEGGEILTGYPAADFLRGERHFSELIHPDDRQRVWAEVQSALAAQRDFRLQYRMLDRTGTLHWCYDEGRGVFDAQGALLHLEGLVRSDDARHQAEDARGRLQALVEASPQAVGWCEPDGTVRYFNAALRKLLAVPAGAEVSGYRLRDFYTERVYEQIESTVLPAVVAQGAWIGEVEISSLDGRLVPTLHSVFVLRDEAGGITAMANVITDLSEIRAAQRDLRIKEAAIATSTSAIALAGLDGAITYVNQAFVELWRLAGPQDALGRSVLSFWDEPDRVQAVVVDSMGRTGHWQGELIGRRADGSLMDVELVGHMAIDTDGKPLCMMGSFLDVTARHQTLRALQQERDFAKSLLDTAPVIVLLLDPRGMIQHVNPCFEHLTGYRLDEIAGKEWFATCLPAHDRARIRALFATAIDDQPVRGYINPIVTRYGEERQIEWHAMPQRDAGGQMTGLLSIGLDVTERQQLEGHLRELTQSLEQRVVERTAEVELVSRRNAAILEAAIDGFFAADISGRIRQANPAFCAMLGYDEAELLRMSVVDIEDQQSHSEIAAHIQIGITQGYDRFDTRHRRKSGDTLEVELSVSLVRLGDEPMFYGFVRDIGPRKAAEEMLRQARDEAERANAAKSEFLSRMSHELRTPLNAVLGFAQVLQMPGGPPLSTLQAGHVRQIQDAGEHLLELVNEVLDLARIESGRLDINAVPVALQPAIERCVAQIEGLAQARRIGMTLPPGVSCTVLADPLRLQQVLLNLLSNAVKYNREGGSIELACAPVAGQRVRVSVRDDGRGLNAEQQARLFRPFERLQATHSGIQGTGIGLALAKHLIQGMQGAIGVDSVPGEGSTFWFELPLCHLPTPSPANGPVAGVGASPQSGKRTVLYVEDDPANLRLVQKILSKRADIELLAAGNADDGVVLAARSRPDLILLDINLPGVDGFAILQRLRAEPATRTTPVIAVTSKAMTRDIECGRAEGFTEYLTQPINVAGFLETLDRCLPGRKGDKP